MKRFSCVAISMMAVFLCASSAMAQSTLVFDRGLPTQNLNNAAGANRSNVSWAFANDWPTGDDFTIGNPGEVWVVTKIVGWNTQGAPNGLEQGDRFQSVALYGGAVGQPLVKLSEGNLSLGSSINSNPNITHTRVTYNNDGVTHYQGSSGAYIQLWQNSVGHLTWVINGGQKYNFSSHGLLQDGVNYYWFNHASNAALSGSPQAGADNKFFVWNLPDPLTLYSFDSKPVSQGGDGGWDKSSDLNVQVWAEKLGEGMATGGGWFVPEAANASGIVTDGSRANFGFISRNKNSVASGNLEFQYSASDINLKSSSYDWVQVSASQAIFEGTGTINGTGAFKFRVRAVDGDKLGGGVSDRFEIRIWTGGGTFDAPLHRAEGDLGGGQIVVHKK